MTAIRSTLRATFRLPALLATLLLAALPGAVQAQLKIDITRGNVDPLPIAITAFHAAAPDVAATGRDIAGVITANLDRSGLFRAVDTRAFLQRPEEMVDRTPTFADWRAIAAQALVTGKVALAADGRLEVEFRLWDVLASQQLVGFSYTTPAANWRRIAHIISDEIYKRLTGEDGYFDTRIVYVSEAGPAQQRVKRLAIMDQDGANHRYLTDGGYLVLTPRFSPTRQEITYLSYARNRPRVFLYNIDTGQQEVLGDFPSMTFSPRFSPDGNAVIFSQAQSGNTDIYVMDLRSREVRRLTNNPAIDTSPAYSPDGRFVTFNSDRGGSQQIYVMQADGSEVKRISFASGRVSYATPVWSPRGDLIAFTRIDYDQPESRRFAIGVVRPDGTGERVLSTSFLDEGPTWSPNGRVLIFFRQEPGGAADPGGRTRLWSIDLTGYNERELGTPGDASDPAWSPPAPLSVTNR